MAQTSESLASLSLTTLDSMQVVFNRLGAERAIGQLYAVAVKEAAALFRATQCGLMLYDAATDSLRFLGPGIGVDAIQAEAFSATSPDIVRQLLAHWPEHGVVRLLDPEYVAFADPAIVARLEERDVLLARIRAEDQLIGLLRLANKADGAAFSEEEAHLLGFYASQLGLLIHNLRVLAQERRQRQLAETLLRVPQVGLPTGRAAEPAGRPQESLRVVLDRLLELLNEVIDYSSATVTLLEAGHLNIIAGRGHSIAPDIIGFGWAAESDRKVQDILAAGEPLYLPDTYGDPRWVMFPGSEPIRAWIGAPIWVPGSARQRPDDLIGVLNVDADRVGAFTDADIAVTQVFADQMAIVLENQRLYASIARRAAELTLINRISNTLSASLEIEAVLQKAVTELAQALDVEQTGVVIFDWRAGYGTIVAEYQRYPDDTGKDTVIPVAGNLSLVRVLETKAPLVIRDVQDDPLIANVRDVLIKRGVKSLLLLPLIVRGEVIGTIGLDELNKVRDFDPTDISLAQTITNQAASAIANAQLFADIKRRAAQLQTIQEVTGHISAILDPEALLIQVPDLLTERFGYYHVHIFLVDESGEYLIARGGSGAAGRELVVSGMRLKIGEEGLCGWVAASGESVVVGDVTTDPRYLSHPLLAETRSEITVPMKLGGQVMGLLDVQSNRQYAFDDTDRFLLETLADQIAIALENARLYRALEERAQQLSAAYEEVKALDRMKDEFVQTVSHELRTPLTFIKGYVELLLEGMLGDLTQEQTDALQVMGQRTDNVIHLVNDIISLTRAETMPLAVKPIDLAEVAAAAVISAKAISDQAGIHLKIDFPETLPLVQGDRQRLNQVFDNLIGNAIKFSPDGGQVQVILSPEDRCVRAEIRDHGIGIPADKLERIWERFYQVDSTATRRFGGTGLGLAISKHLVEALGGAIGVHSIEGKGSTFWFTVPCADEQNGELVDW